MSPPQPQPQPPLPLPKFLGEEELTQECRDLVSILPSDEGWVLNPFTQYQGFWYQSSQMLGVLRCQKHFQAQDTNIFLVTTPKSGTSWLKAITFALVNRVSHQPNSREHPLLTSNPHVLVPFFEIEYNDNEVPDLTTFTSPSLFSTHLPFVSLPKSVKDSACKLVYLCRNPKDTFVSLWHYTNELRPKNRGPNSLEDAIDKFCRGVSVYGPFWDHVLGYWKESLENPQRIFFLKYEEMKEQPTVHLRRLAEFLECPFSPEEEAQGVVDEILNLCSFDHLRNLEVNKREKLSTGEENTVFFRKGKVGDWMNYLTPEMIERLDDITERKFQGSGLKF